MAKLKKAALSDEVKEFFRRSGRKGGKNSRKNLTKEERRELGQRAANARWAKKAAQAAKILVLLAVLLTAVRSAAKDWPKWESAMVISQELGAAPGGAYAGPLGGGAIAVPLYRRFSHVVLDTGAYQIGLDEAGRKPLILVVNDKVQFYRDGKFFIILDAQGKKHKFGVTGIVKNE